MRSWPRTFSIVRMHTVANSDSTAAVLSGSGAAGPHGPAPTGPGTAPSHDLIDFLDAAGNPRLLVTRRTASRRQQLVLQDPLRRTRIAERIRGESVG